MPQNLTASLTELSDASLVNLVRDGNDAAYSVLWERHRQAAHTAARGISSHDPEDMTQEAFVRILQAIRNGAGPTEGFRPYLYTTLRTISMAWSAKDPSTLALDEQIDSLGVGTDLQDDSADRGMTVRAFAALPKEWRTVLWYTEVEGMTPAEVAPILGMTAGAVAALSFRARNGLRESWLQTHSAAVSPDTPEDCKWAQRHFASYLRDSISARRAQRLQNHLVDCFPCSASFAELSEVNGSLRGLLLPLFLGVPIAALYESGLLLAPTIGALAVSPPAGFVPFPAAHQWIAANKTVAVGAAVGGVAVAAAGIALALTSLSSTEPPAEPVASQTAADPQSAASGSSGQSAAVTPSASPESEAPEDAPDSSDVLNPGDVPDPELADPQSPQPYTTRAPISGATSPAAVSPKPTPSTEVTTPGPVEPTNGAAVLEPTSDPSGPGVSTPEPTAAPTEPSNPADSTPDPADSVEPTPDPTPNPTPDPTKTTSPVDPTPDPTDPPEDVVPDMAELVVESVVHTPAFMPQVSGTGEPGAIVQTLRGGVVIGEVSIPESGEWIFNVPSIEVTSPQTTLQFEVRQVITDPDGHETVSPSAPLRNSDGSTDFTVQAPSWSHMSKSANIAVGSPTAVSPGGTISVRGNKNDGIFFYFVGAQSSQIRVHINGSPTITLHPGGSLLQRTWTNNWQQSDAGPQRIELSYSDGERRGPHVAFEFDLVVQ